jgi:DNA gyrase subunit B
MLSKYKQIEPYMEPPFIVESIPKASSKKEASADDEDDDTNGAENETVEKKATAKAAAKRKPEPVIVEKTNVRDLFDYVLSEGKKDFTVQRYKGLGEMTAEQLWETTMDPERRTLLSVKLEDIAETETIFTTLMGEDVESRRKFIEENALDVKNLDI